MTGARCEWCDAPATRTVRGRGDMEDRQACGPCADRDALASAHERGES